ncbi:putative transmembrane protein [Senna tora]|uniref:Putative transmembrane protein n=1 Tax=Senna tora TaxID=362788 RepID=A0A835CF70_9FABA|nr:putative transmembrane protein [Senna tora]
MENTLFRLFVILLGLSHLLCLQLQAIPVTRTESLMQGPQVHFVLENTHKSKQVTTTERNFQWEEPSVVTTTDERMDLELHDYPPSGANGRHTPRAP